MSGPFQKAKAKRASRGERNANEGNIEDGPWARSQPGYAGTDGRFAKFDNPEAGNAAQVKLIRDGKRYRGKPLSGIIQVYAPLGDNSEASVRNYIGYVAARAGIDPDGQIPPEKYDAVAAAMREFETGKRPKIQFASYGGQLSGSGRATQGSTPVTQAAPSVDVTQIKPTAGEQARTSVDPYDIQNPFDPALAAEAKTRVGDVQKRAEAADTVLQGVIGELQSIQPQREQRLEQAVQAKQAISSEIRSEATGLIERMRPLFQKREAVARRRTELTEMNPLEQLFRGITDPNYNEVSLRGADYAAATELGVLGENFKTLASLQETILNTLQADYEGDESVWQLQRQNLIEDVSLIAQSLGMSETRLGAAMKGLDTQMAIIGQRQTAINVTLDKMSVGETNAALEKAESDPNGYAVVNGVPLSVGQLRDRQRRFVDLQADMESRQLALETNREQLAMHYERKMLKNMSDSELEGALAEGGKFKGQQLDRVQVAAELESRRTIRAKEAEQVGLQSGPGTVKMLAQQVANQSQTTQQRMLLMLGQVPEEQKQLMAGLATGLNALAAEFESANKRGVGKEWAAQNLPRFQALQQAQDKVIDQVANRWAGGNKTLLPLAQGWLRGAPINSETAAKGLISMARNGLPAGTKLQGPALQAFRQAQALVKQSDTPQGNQTVADMMNADPASKAEKERKLIQDVSAQVSKVYSQQLGNALTKETVTIAREIRINGKAHPFSFVDPAVYQQALGHAEQTAQESKAATAKERNAIRMRALLDGLDAMTDLSQQGTTASKALIDLYNRPEFHAKAGEFARQYSQRNGFSDYLISSMGRTNVSDSLMQMRDTLAMTASVRNTDIMRARIEEARSMRGDPWKRASMIVNGIEGVSPAEGKKLLSAIQASLNNDTIGRGEGHFLANEPGATFAQGVAEMQGDQLARIEYIINNVKARDPELESIRRRVAAKWTPMRNTLDRMFGRGE